MKLYFILTVWLIAIIGHGRAGDEASDWFSNQQDTSEWVDPHDMFSFDPSTKSNVNQRSRSTQTDTVHACGAPKECRDNCDKLEAKLVSCRRDLEEYRKMDRTDSKFCEHRADVFFRRLSQKAVNRLTRLLTELPSDSDVEHFAIFQIRPEEVDQLKALADFSKPLDCNDLEQAANVLDRVLDELDIIGRETWLSRAFSLLPYVFLLALAAYILYIFRHHPYLFLFLLFISTCFGMQWYKLYLNVKAEREKSLHENHHVTCTRRNKDSSWFGLGMFGQWWRAQTSFDYKQDDPCLKYFQALYVDPIFEINPAQPLMEVLSIFFFSPLEHLGHYSGASIGKFFAHIPSLHFFWVVPFLLLIVITVIISFAGLVREVPFGRAVRRLVNGRRISIEQQHYDRLDNNATDRNHPLRSRRDTFMRQRITVRPLPTQSTVSKPTARESTIAHPRSQSLDACPRLYN